MVDLIHSRVLAAGLILIRRRPAAVAAWGLVVGAFVLAAILLMAPQILAMFRRFHAGVVPQDVMGSLVQIQASMMLFNIVSFFVRAVIIAAVFRAVLEPEKSAFGYMRVGMAELFIAILMLGEGIAIGLLAIVVAAPFVLTVVWLALAHYVAGAIMTGIVGVAVITVLAVWLALRLSLLGPMIIVKADFPLSEAWALTRGNVASLLAVAIIAGLLVMVLEVVVGGASAVLCLTALGGLPHGLYGLRNLSSVSLPSLLAEFAPWLVVAWLIWSLFIGAAAAIFCAPWAAAYRQLTQSPAPQPAA